MRSRSPRAAGTLPNGVLSFGGFLGARRPLGERKEFLRSLLLRPTGIYLCRHDDGDGDALFAAACRMGLEGIISKRIDSPRIAMRNMITLLDTHYGIGFHDAYRLCSVAGDIRVTQFVNANRRIHVMLPLAPLAGLGKRPAFLEGIEDIAV